MSTQTMYITIPKPQLVTRVKAGSNPPELERAPFTWFDLLRQFAWTDPRWRDDANHARALNNLYPAIKEAEDLGLPFVGALQEDFAIFKPIATLQGKELGGPDIFALNQLTQCVTFASSTKPDLPMPAHVNGVSQETETKSTVEAAPAPS
jgi:hypothetical protein